ncbi:MAG: hypothetical protein GX862_07040 [Leucobacter sp.]|nr:hypothetical protein [Leucobacter sp.]
MLARTLKVELWRFALPILWFGMVAAISFIEAPLKFQAPGITIPLGLGIGRLVFAALNLAEGLILLAYTLLAFFPTQARLSAQRLWVWGGLLVVFLFKLAVVRPPLNARTDLVLAGAEPGQSPWHYIYIACDVITMVLLLVASVQAGRAILVATTSRAAQ